jgi:hypothetical protein
VFLNLLERCFFFQFGMVARRKVYQELGPFRTDLIRSQDYEMALRLARRFRGVFVPQTVFLQRKHAGVRGAGADRFQSDAMLERWLHYDRLIFAGLAEDLTLDELTPTFARAEEPTRRRRAALLERALIFGRRAMWDIAVESVEAASLIESDQGPSRGESRVASELLFDHLPNARLAAEPKLLARLRACRTRGRFGRALIKTATQPLAWQLRHAVTGRQLSETATPLRLLSGLLGPSGASIRLIDFARSALARQLAPRGSKRSPETEFGSVS